MSNNSKATDQESLSKAEGASDVTVQDATAEVSKPSVSIKMDETEPRWFAVYTRYKREKQVHKQLLHQNIETYLPLQSYTRKYQRKVKHISTPLINCYIFTKIIKSQYVQVLATPEVVHFVKTAKDLIAIPEKEIEIMRRVVGEETEVEVQEGRYELGDEVEIIGGNLTGLKGWLINAANEKNLVIELENLGYSLRISVDPALLQKTGRRAPQLIENGKAQRSFGW